MCNPASIYLKALALDTRLRIIELLKSNGPMFVSDIAREIQTTPSAISQHLKLLRFAGLVRSERQGFYIAYRVDHDALKCCQMTMDDLCRCSCCSPPEHAEDEFQDADMEELKNREQALRSELRTIRNRIRQQTKKKP